MDKSQQLSPTLDPTQPDWLKNAVVWVLLMFFTNIIQYDTMGRP